MPRDPVRLSKEWKDAEDEALARTRRKLYRNEDEALEEYRELRQDLYDDEMFGD